MKRSHWKILTAALLVTAAVTPAFAEVLKDDPKATPTGRTDEARQNDAAFDAQYRARRNSDDSAAPKADPWGGVRTPAAQPAATATSKKTKN